MSGLPNPQNIAARALGLPDGVEIDAYAGATLGPDGDLRLRFTSGRELVASVSAPTQGALRVRVGEPMHSPMLAFAAAPPATLRIDGGRMIASADGIEAAWGPSGEFQAGELVRTTADGVMGLPGLGAGRAFLHGEPIGWLERFRLEPGAGIFGGGESNQGPQLRGRLRVLRNAETTGTAGYDLSYLNVPFFWSDAGWGIFAHSGAAVHADLGATSSEVMTLAVPGAALDLFYLVGTPEQILRRYLALTGHPGTLPDWALGVWLSRCSYVSETHLHEVLDEAEAAQCPVDVLHVDAWQDGNVLEDLACNWSPDTARFPAGWVQRIQQRGARVSLWLNPYVPASAPVVNQLDGCFATSPDGSAAQTPDIAGRLVLDFTSDTTRDWWRRRIAGLREIEPFDALKADFGEETPEQAWFADGRDGAQLRNEYSLLYQQATHAALADGGTEPVLFCRSGTAGSQRYPCHWVGDSASTWDGLVTALRGCLSLSLSGFAWVAHDVGGFWANGSDDTHIRALAMEDPHLALPDVDPELFVRWAQWAAFSPVMRFHGTGAREPFAYPEPYRRHAVHAAQVRRALRPYLVQVAETVAATGLPAMRPMALAYPNHPEASDALQYLLGPDLLVAPVLRPGGAVRMWLPPGQWRRFLDATELCGPRWVTTMCDLSQFPAFVRITDGEPPWYQALPGAIPPPAPVRG